jgi:hypothetical protein
MPLTDSYGQGIQYSTLTDKPNAQTLGQGLVDGLTPKVVMTFASGIVRGATITTPKAGMVTWLKDVGRLEVYDGTAWVSFAFGANTWKTISPPAAVDDWPGWAQNGNSQGTFQYRVVNLFGEDAIMFRGGLARNGYSGAIPSYYTLNATALPANARPSSLRTILVPCSDVGSARIALKMDVTTDGWLRLYGISTPSNLPAWVGFNGCFASL